MQTPPAKDDSPLSLRRLTDAFAAMMGRGPQRPGPASTPPGEATPNPRSIVEALLFVGRPDNKPLSAEVLAATMRDVTAEEVERAIAALNAQYEADESAYRVESSAQGHRLVLREELGRACDRLTGRTREATLSPTALEVLAVVAYRQPLTLAEVDELRGAKSSGPLSQLVRRRLVACRPREDGQKQYTTTERFLKVFGLSSVAELPRAEEFDLPADDPPPPTLAVIGR